MVSHDGGASSGDTSSEASGGGGGGNGGAKQGLKKGPWTAAEDAILIEYVKKHGEGNWNAVQRNSGLWRCGKSCRLRWANHLRPNLKKGAFSSEEERLIIELHAKLGNKWARMAAQLPGRTDNEIKNYWNTRTKRRQRAGLPLYPQEIQRDAAVFHLHNQQRQQRQEQNHHHNAHSSSSSLPSFLSPSHNQKPTYNPSLSLFDPIKFSPPTVNPIQTHPNSTFLSNNHHQFKLFHDTNNGGFAFPLSPVLPYPSPSSSQFNQTLLATQLLPTPPLQFNPGNFKLNHSNNLGTQFEPTSFIPLLKTELPSSQTPTCSATSSGDYVMAASSSANDYVVAPPQMWRGNSGLLDDLLKEAQDLSRNENSREEQLMVLDKGKSVVDEFVEDAGVQHLGSVFRGDSRDVTPENQWDESSSGQSSLGMKRNKQTIEEMNSIDDELTSLLETFPSAMPVPEWYRGSGDGSNGQSSSMTGGAAVLDIDQEASPSPAAATGMDHGLILDSCWNNMPSIC